MSDEDDFEWREVKRISNIARHGIDFEDARLFDWDTSLTREDDDAEGEQRMLSIGLIYGVVHAMVWTERNGKVRVISLRRATRREKKLFEG